MKIAQILMSQAWGDVNLDTPNLGLGGRETALIRLGEQWAKAGHEVHCFVPVQNGTLKKFPSNGSLHFLPVELAQTMMANFEYDAGVAWECPSVFGNEKIRENVKVRLTEMQVAHFTGYEAQHAAEYCHGVCALSEWHKEFLLHSGLEMDPDKVIVHPNGVDIERYPVRADLGVLGTESPSFVYSSSPDRGLNHLLDAWPEIRDRYPGAVLYVGYGAAKFAEQHKWAHNRTAQMAVDIIAGLKQKGVIDLGKIGQDKLAKLQLKADVWLYPCDPINATETGCITAVENAAAGCPMVISDADCLPSEFGQIAEVSELPFNRDDFLGSLEYIITQPAVYEEMAVNGRKFAESRDWSLIAPRWIETIKSLS
jgi:glycosyltransferase involved in cell wall biosynthesis